MAAHHSNQDSLEGPPPDLVRRRRLSWGLSILVPILVMGLVFVIGYPRTTLTHDPAAVRAIADRIRPIRWPEGFTPAVGLEVRLVLHKRPHTAWAVFEDSTKKNVIAVAELRTYGKRDKLQALETLFEQLLQERGVTLPQVNREPREKKEPPRLVTDRISFIATRGTDALTKAPWLRAVARDVIDDAPDSATVFLFSVDPVQYPQPWLVEFLEASGPPAAKPLPAHNAPTADERTP